MACGNTRYHLFMGFIGIISYIRYCFHTGCTTMSFDNWLTPPDVIELARETMGSIDFDPASNYIAQGYVKAGEYCIAPDDIESYLHAKQKILNVDGLNARWQANVWCNPPYSRDLIKEFSSKAIREWGRDPLHWTDPVTQMMVLVNSATDAGWYHDLLSTCSVALLFKGRLKFWKIENGAAHERWEGQLSKDKGLGKIGNSPRYLNTLFYFGRTKDQVENFVARWQHKGAIIKTWYNTLSEN